MPHNEIRSFRGPHFFLSNFYRCAFNALKSNTGGRVSVMHEVLTCKFDQPNLTVALRTTGHARLVEGNVHHDNFWGDCTCGRPSCTQPGLNMLGELLMEVRTDLGYGYTQPAQYRDIGTWDAMTDWLVAALDDQPAGLVISLGEARPGDDTNAIREPVDLSSPMSARRTDTPAPLRAVCAQLHLLNNDVILVRRSRLLMSALRLYDHNSSGLVLDTWHRDDPFGDCTDGYLYTRDRQTAAQACATWFRDVRDGPHLNEIGANYSFAVVPPPGEPTG